MSKWLVSQGDRQFSANDLAELKALVTSGKLRGADMIQPPGASDWLYVSELPALAELLPKSKGSSGDFDDDGPARGGGGTLVLGIIGLLTIAAAAGGMYYYYLQFPDYSKMDMFEDAGLGYSQVILTQDAQVLDKPDGAARGSLPKDSRADLMGKRGEWYEIKGEGGVQGYIRIDQAVAGYAMADERVQKQYDPLYNPDKYVFVKNASWMQIDQQNRNLTIFQFMLQNTSRFDMADVTLLAIIKDEAGREVEQVEIPMEGIIPANNDTMVGTLGAEPKVGQDTPKLVTSFSFNKLAETDETLYERWAEGVEVEMKSKDFKEGIIELLQLRAVPPAEATQ